MPVLSTNLTFQVRPDGYIRPASWHRSNDSLLAEPRSHARFGALLEAEREQYDSSMQSIADLSPDLADAGIRS